MLKALVSGMFLVSSVGFAADDHIPMTIDELADATKKAIASLSQEDPTTAETLSGFKGELMETDAVVELFAKTAEGDVQSVVYKCHKHADSGNVDCHKQ